VQNFSIFHYHDDEKREKGKQQDNQDVEGNGREAEREDHPFGRD
jgi:hypothetical protein